MPDVATTLGLPAGQRFEYWKHPAHFSRLFKASFGLSPRDYRASFLVPS